MNYNLLMLGRFKRILSVITEINILQLLNTLLRTRSPQTSNHSHSTIFYSLINAAVLQLMIILHWSRKHQDNSLSLSIMMSLNLIRVRKNMGQTPIRRNT